MLTSQRFDSDGMETFAACGTEWQQELRGVSSGSTRKPKYSEMCSYMGYKKSRNETQQQPRIIHLFSHDRLFCWCPARNRSWKSLPASKTIQKWICRLADYPIWAGLSAASIPLALNNLSFSGRHEWPLQQWHVIFSTIYFLQKLLDHSKLLKLPLKFCSIQAENVYIIKSKPH